MSGFLLGPLGKRGLAPEQSAGACLHFAGMSVLVPGVVLRQNGRVNGDRHRSKPTGASPR